MTIFNNWLMRRRQNKLEIEKVRMESISKSAPLYEKIALYNSWNLSHQLRLPAGQRDNELMFYYLCNILNLRRQIINVIGDLQFTDLTAERIIGDLGRNIVGLVIDHFGQLDTSRLTSLVDNDLPFHQFHTIISENGNSEFFHNFEQLIAVQESVQKLEQNCRWYAELIMYELTYMYMIWYREPPEFLGLDADLRAHLEQNHRDYLRRLLKIETGSWL
jgi:hypothetical protein